MALQQSGFSVSLSLSELDEIIAIGSPNTHCNRNCRIQNAKIARNGYSGWQGSIVLNERTQTRALIILIMTKSQTLCRIIKSLINELIRQLISLIHMGTDVNTSVFTFPATVRLNLTFVNVIMMSISDMAVVYFRNPPVS